MKKIWIWLLCAALLLTGCGNDAGDVTEPLTQDTVMTTEETAAPTAAMTTEPATEETTTPETPETDGEQAALETIRGWLDEDFSFSISLQYMNLAVNGITQEITQELAKDGSFHFIDSFRQWSHASDIDVSEKMEYYYRYEDGVLVCYMRANDGEPERAELTAETEADMEKSRTQLVGSAGLLPQYLEDFHKTAENGETGTCTYTYMLPLEMVVEDYNLLSSLVYYAYTLYGSEFDPETDITITANLEVEQDTLRPVKLTYDFSELKPHVLPEGALSAEYAIGLDGLYLVYTFDDEMPETMEIPAEFIPAN